MSESVRLVSGQVKSWIAFFGLWNCSYRGFYLPTMMRNLLWPWKESFSCWHIMNPVSAMPLLWIWVATFCVTESIPHTVLFDPEDRCRMFLQNSGMFLPEYTVSQPLEDHSLSNHRIGNFKTHIDNSFIGNFLFLHYFILLIICVWIIQFWLIYVILGLHNFVEHRKFTHHFQLPV
jgi:hypothetical protein